MTAGVVTAGHRSRRTASASAAAPGAVTCSSRRNRAASSNGRPEAGGLELAGGDEAVHTAVDGDLGGIAPLYEEPAVFGDDEGLHVGDHGPGQQVEGVGDLVPQRQAAGAVLVGQGLGGVELVEVAAGTESETAVVDGQQAVAGAVREQGGTVDRAEGGAVGGEALGEQVRTQWCDGRRQGPDQAEVVDGNGTSGHPKG
jgi:hypothetical protein